MTISNFNPIEGGLLQTAARSAPFRKWRTTGVNPSEGRPDPPSAIRIALRRCEWYLYPGGKFVLDHGRFRAVGTYSAIPEGYKLRIKQGDFDNKNKIDVTGTIILGQPSWIPELHGKLIREHHAFDAKVRLEAL